MSPSLSSFFRTERRSQDERPQPKPREAPPPPDLFRTDYVPPRSGAPPPQNDYFRGTGRLPSSRSNPSLYHPDPLPVNPPRVPLNAFEHHFRPAPPPPPKPFAYASMRQPASTSQLPPPSTATVTRPPTHFGSPPHPSRSLVDLYNPHRQDRRASVDANRTPTSQKKPLVETAM